MTHKKLLCVIFMINTILRAVVRFSNPEAGRGNNGLSISFICIYSEPPPQTPSNNGSDFVCKFVNSRVFLLRQIWIVNYYVKSSAKNSQ